MTYHFDGRNYIVRLQKGELLQKSLVGLAKEANLGSVWLNGLGGAQWVELGFYKLPEKEYEYKRIGKLLEITSLQGNLAWQDGEPVWHIHGTFGDDTYQIFGGHVRELSAGGTCELLLHTVQGEPLTRVKDDTVGLSLLAI